MSTYQPPDFWEKSHASVSSASVRQGSGIRHVGGGQSDSEATALYYLRRINADRTLQKCRLPPNPKIFELGSGGGFWVEFFKRLTPSLFVGSDLSPTAVDRLRDAYPDCCFISLNDGGPAWRNIAERGPYDLCLAIDVLYHIVDDSSWSLALKNLCENCKPGGWLLLADYFYAQPREIPSLSHVKHRSAQAYLDVLDEYNFGVTHIQPIFYLLNRTVSGPWQDQNKLISRILRLLTSNPVGLRIVELVDRVATVLIRPMNPRCKTRFLLAYRKSLAETNPVAEAGLTSSSDLQG